MSAKLALTPDDLGTNSYPRESGIGDSDIDCRAVAQALVRRGAVPPRAVV